MPQVTHILDQDCLTRQTLELLSDKWKSLILHALCDGPLRYGQLKRIIPDITHKMLAQTLKNLEQDGLVQRTLFPTNPPTVEYNLTPLGQTLIPILSELCKWAEDNFQKVLAARNRQIFEGEYEQIA